MVLSLLFGKKYAQTKIGAVFLDATLSETHNFVARVSSFPIEYNFSISDHVVIEPISLSIRGLVSDTPLNILSAFNRSIDSFNALLNVFNRKERLTVVTGIRVYRNMLITNLNIPRDVGTGQSLTFDIALQQVLYDTDIRLNLSENYPFKPTVVKIPRQSVAEANKYPNFEQDPVTSFKDQASTPQDAGIQDLQPIPKEVLAKVITGSQILTGFV